jgi:hypothetical protein
MRKSTILTTTILSAPLFLGACSFLNGTSTTYTLAQAQAEGTELQSALTTVVTVAEATGYLTGTYATEANTGLIAVDQAVSALNAVPATGSYSAQLDAVVTQVEALEPMLKLSTNTQTDINAALAVLESVVSTSTTKSAVLHTTAPVKIRTN